MRNDLRIAVIGTALAMMARDATALDTQDRTRIVKVPELEPNDFRDYSAKKSKGDKKKARAERRRNGGI
jgi:hypothetical protein